MSELPSSVLAVLLADECKQLDRTADKKTSPYKQFRAQQEEERRDHRARRVLWAAGKPLTETVDLKTFAETDDGVFALIARHEERPPAKVKARGKQMTDSGGLRYEPPAG